MSDTTLYTDLRAAIAEALTNRNRGDLAERIDRLTDDEIHECERLMVDRAETLLEGN